MKKYFFPGLAILLPFAITVFIANFFINLLTNPFLGALTSFFNYFGIFSPETTALLSQNPFMLLLAKLLILIVLGAVIFLTGFLCQALALHYLFRLSDFIIHKIPVINRVYKAAKEVVDTVFSEKQNTFSKAVLVPFPQSGVLGVGFLMGQRLPQGSDEGHQELVPVFLPGTPNPMMGFMLLYKKEEVIFLEATADQALKFIVSCGSNYSGFGVEPRLEPFREDATFKL